MTQETRVRVRRRLVLLAILTVLASGCSGRLQFRTDHRVHVEAPRPRRIVAVPLTVRWTYRDFTVTGPTNERDRGRGYFGVFVDRAPMPAGRNLHWLAKGDRSCRAGDGCPDVTYLANRRVFTTTKPTITIGQLPLPAYHKGLEDHTVVIVLLDGRGTRIGESAWYVDFRVRRSA